MMPMGLEGGRITKEPRVNLIKTGEMTEIHYVPYDLVPKVWNFIKDDVKRITDKVGDRYNEDIALEMMLGGDTVTWIVMDGDRKLGIVMTQMVTYPTGVKAARFEAAAGMLPEDWLKHKDIIEKWAIDNGADYIELVGRIGWTKYMDDYKPQGVILSKDLRG